VRKAAEQSTVNVLVHPLSGVHLFGWPKSARLSLRQAITCRAGQSRARAADVAPCMPGAPPTSEHKSSQSAWPKHVQEKVWRTQQGTERQKVWRTQQEHVAPAATHRDRHKDRKSDRQTSHARLRAAAVGGAGAVCGWWCCCLHPIRHCGHVGRLTKTAVWRLRTSAHTCTRTRTREQTCVCDKKQSIIMTISGQAACGKAIECCRRAAMQQQAHAWRACVRCGARAPARRKLAAVQNAQACPTRPRKTAQHVVRLSTSIHQPSVCAPVTCVHSHKFWRQLWK
jgi:hypothetical protein